MSTRLIIKHLSERKKRALIWLSPYSTSTDLYPECIIGLQAKHLPEGVGRTTMSHLRYQGLVIFHKEPGQVFSSYILTRRGMQIAQILADDTLSNA